MTPCLTIWQPYAALIAAGVKTSETRRWAAAPAFIGQRIGIHAAVRRPRQDEIDHMAPLVTAALDLPDWAESLVYGAIVCTARLLGCFQVSGHDDGLVLLDGHAPIVEDRWGDYARRRWVWPLDQIEVLAEPRPMSGHRGWWWADLA